MKKLIALATILVCSALFAIEPYDSVRLVSYEPYFFENSWILLNKVNSQGATVFIDVESPEGEAARFIAANTSDSTKVYNINSWEGNDYSFQKFLSNVAQESLSERVIPLRMNSKEAGTVTNLISEIVYIDSQDISSINDKILTWVTHLSEHGVIAGNKWEWPEVELAVVNAAVSLNLILSTDANFWFLQKE